MLEVIDLPLKDAKLFKLGRHHDNRGWFTETFRQSWLRDHNIDTNFIFEYCSFNTNADTIRGLHAQTADAPQTKLVSVLNGSILDVLVDARLDSPTYGKYCTVELEKSQPSIVYVPPGFYHGFVTLEPNTYVLYKLDNYHNSAAECGVMWNDDTLNIQWPLSGSGTRTISQRDQMHPQWSEAYKF
jgi:dTDP-4-dehydrorhamnose 3,5-epimerase